MSNVLILGYGVEGQAAVRYFLKHTDKQIVVADQRGEDGPAPFADRQDPRLKWVSEKSALDHLRDDTLLLRSPGLPPVHPVLAAARARGLRITTPTGYWIENLAPADTLTITGTKGKSTTVSMIAFLLERLGLPTAALGNIGAPPLDEKLPVATHPVLELSSYMMHDLPNGPYTHVVTSLYKEHTTWHGSEDAYRAAKLRPFFYENPVRGFAPRQIIDENELPSSVIAVEDRVPVKAGVLQIGEHGVIAAELNERFHSAGDLAALRMACAVLLDSVDPTTLVQALRKHLGGYHGLPSRQELLPTTDGRLWVNDALATVPEATIVAMRRFADQPITLLLGGADRGQRFEGLVDAIKADGSTRPIVFGTTGERLAPMLKRAGVAFIEAASLEEAVTAALQKTAVGSVILFSPAAASEPPYADYRARADVIRAAAAGAIMPM